MTCFYHEKLADITPAVFHVKYGGGGGGMVTTSVTYNVTVAIGVGYNSARDITRHGETIPVPEIVE